MEKHEVRQTLIGPDLRQCEVSSTGVTSYYTVGQVRLGSIYYSYQAGVSNSLPTA